MLKKKKNQISDILKKYTVAFLLTTGLFIPSAVMSQQPLSIAASMEACNSYILISGESNINRFNFIYDLRELEPFEAYSRLKDSSQFELNIPIKDFRASNPSMYNDFLQLMKASQYPRITIGIPKDQLFATVKSYYSPDPEMRITIAGITHTYRIDCSLENCTENRILIGSQKIRLSDFDLKPPEKLYGLVKVNNEITVNFSFIITFTNSNLLARAE